MLRFIFAVIGLVEMAVSTAVKFVFSRQFRRRIFVRSLIAQKASLSGMDLSRMDLSHADLRGMDLSGANLSDTNLTGANLCGANLRHANLTGVTGLLEAQLDFAQLRHAAVDDKWVGRMAVLDILGGWSVCVQDGHTLIGPYSQSNREWLQDKLPTSGLSSWWIKYGEVVKALIRVVDTYDNSDI